LLHQLLQLHEVNIVRKLVWTVWFYNISQIFTERISLFGLIGYNSMTEVEQ
jgi:hypothetical protein